MYVLTTVKNLNILFNEKPEKKKKDIETDTKVCHKHVRGTFRR